MVKSKKKNKDANVVIDEIKSEMKRDWERSSVTLLSVVRILNFTLH